MYPYYPDEENTGHFDLITNEEKYVALYLNASILDVYDLSVFDFWLFLRDAVIYLNSQTEDGREYLEKCWIITQTKPERKKLRDKFGKG